MNDLAFFDTNILIYTDDKSSAEKQNVAITLFARHLRNGTAVVSLQVLQEYFVASTRKLKVSPEVAQQKVHTIALAHVVRLDVQDVVAAIELHRLTRISFWDALIAHAARMAGAATLYTEYTEDFQSGATLAGVRVVNPFS